MNPDTDKAPIWRILDEALANRTSPDYVPPVDDEDAIRRDGVTTGVAMALDFFGVPDGAPLAEALYEYAVARYQDERYAS